MLYGVYSPLALGAVPRGLRDCILHTALTAMPYVLHTVFCRVSAHARISAHPPFLAFLPIWGGTRISAHPSPFDLEARVDIRASAHPVLLCVHVHVRSS